MVYTAFVVSRGCGWAALAFPVVVAVTVVWYIAAYVASRGSLFVPLCSCAKYTVPVLFYTLSLPSPCALWSLQRPLFAFPTAVVSFLPFLLFCFLFPCFLQWLSFFYFYLLYLLHYFCNKPGEGFPAFDVCLQEWLLPFRILEVLAYTKCTIYWLQSWWFRKTKVLSKHTY